MVALSCGKKLVTAYLLGIVVAAAAVAVICRSFSENMQRVSAEHSLTVCRNAVVRSIDLEKISMLSTANRFAEALRMADFVQSGDIAALTETVRQLRLETQLADYVFVLDKHGAIMAAAFSPEAEKQGVDPADFHSYIPGRHRVSLCISSSSRSIDVTASAVVKNPAGEVDATVVAGASVAGENFVDNLKSRFGVEVAVSRNDEQFTTTLLDSATGKAVDAAGDPTRLDTVPGKNQFYAAKKSLGGNTYYSISWPILAEEGQGIGNFSLSIPTAPMDQVSMVLLKKAMADVGIAAAVLAFATGLTFLALRRRTASTGWAASPQLFNAVNTASRQTWSRKVSSSRPASDTSLLPAASSAAVECSVVVAVNEVCDAGRSLREMLASLASVRESTSRVGEVVKPLQNVAFQASLLALDTTGKALREGEGGMVFEAVTEKAHHLALQAAEVTLASAGTVRESLVQSQAELDKAIQATIDLDFFCSN